MSPERIRSCAPINKSLSTFRCQTTGITIHLWNLLVKTTGVNALSVGSHYATVVSTPVEISTHTDRDKSGLTH